MNSTVFKIDDNGKFSEVATYSLPPKEALKNTFLQFVRKNFNTWNYHKEHVNVIETKHAFHVLNGGSSFFVRKNK